jgi:L-alanine-DL-glutamate epimerase-like enolase superfamily enzyme
LLAERHEGALGAGEALFSEAEARLLDRHGGLRRDRDVLLFDPVHCYGVPGYLRIIDELERSGWSRGSFWPHGGHLFCIHLVAALGLGGVEVNPLSFQPFGGLPDGARVERGEVRAPEAAGVGFETRGALFRMFRDLVGG